MPKYTPSDDEMDSGMYGAEPVTPPTEATAGAETESIDRENEEIAAQTAVISNKILSPDGEPLKEGDQIVLEVVKNYGDESEVKYAPKEVGGEETTETSPGVEEELTAMDTEKA